MKYRKLRIVWSVVWGVVAVLLIVLWVRSYWWTDILISNQWEPKDAVSQGRFFHDADYSYPWSRDLRPAYLMQHANGWYEIESLWNPGGNSLSINTARLRVPILPVVVGATAIAFLPWMQQCSVRFSLRTLLIATTLVAIVLGLIVWLHKN